MAKRYVILEKSNIIVAKMDLLTEKDRKAIKSYMSLCDYKIVPYNTKEHKALFNEGTTVNSKYTQEEVKSFLESKAEFDRQVYKYLTEQPTKKETYKKDGTRKLVGHIGALPWFKAKFVVMVNEKEDSKKYKDAKKLVEDTETAVKKALNI
jgi:ribosome biogenesis protein Nip4